jgi:ABC-three component (ABC-3C) system Middle Component 6
MILPSKHLRPDRALISVASEVLELVGRRTTVSSIWNELQAKHSASLRQGVISFDWYVLSLDLLFLMGCIEEKGRYIKRIPSDAA